MNHPITDFECRVDLNVVIASFDRREIKRERFFLSHHPFSLSPFTFSDFLFGLCFFLPFIGQ